jgi:nicotinate-nucleotide adenylyltransferase
MSRLAIFGGTFDPIHKAHVELAHSALERFRLDHLLLIPAAHPPHKASGAHAPYADRVRMAEIACQDDPRIQVSRLEEGTERSYSIDTIEKVRAGIQPGDELFFLIGADAFAEIRTWKRWLEVARLVRFIVAARPGCVYQSPVEVQAERLDDFALPVSSTSIRQALAAGERPAEVPTAVLDYIREHSLYRTTATSG